MALSVGVLVVGGQQDADSARPLVGEPEPNQGGMSVPVWTVSIWNQAPWYGARSVLRRVSMAQSSFAPGAAGVIAAR